MPDGACPRCGAVLDAYAPTGLCGPCLLAAGMELEEPVAPLDAVGSGQRRFGDYELLEEIARGGMGVVFRARQISLNRIVAVKMILSGQFASVAELARFRGEAEVAARLQHPNIVAIHEVGESDGQAYFSMDLVAGQNLAQIVGNTPMLVRRAAVILKTIAEAVDYAHRRGVLHRDLKPSNVLIDSDDQPHITDFGLAKRLTGDASLTMTGQVIGSPNFIPPEQVDSRAGSAGPASDVYSLGALLYHLLTGRPPFVAQSVTATLRLVIEKDAISPQILNPGVPRDLETICLKCLEKSPARRYATAQELADEVGRFLRHEPIRARPLGPGPRLVRWCRRNPAVAVAVAAIITLALVVPIGSSIAVFRIDRARATAVTNQKAAETEAAKSRQVAQFLQNMIRGAGPSVALGRDTTILREILDKTADDIGKELSDQPLVEIELRGILAQTYLELGQFKQSETMARRGLALARSHLSPTNPAVADALQQVGDALGRLQQDTEAERFIREALAMRRGLLGNEHLLVASSLDSLGLVLKHQESWTEAEETIRASLELRRKLLGKDHPLVAGSLYMLALIVHGQRRLPEAEALLRECLATLRKALGDGHLALADPLGTLAFNLRREGKLAEAEALIRESLAIRKKLLGNEHPDVAEATRDLSLVLASQGRLGEAETLAREALAMQKRLLGNEHGAVGASLDNLAKILHREGNLLEVESIYRELAGRGKPKRRLSLAWFLATCEDERLRQSSNAVQLAEQAVSELKEKDGLSLDILAAAYAADGQFPRAIGTEQTAIALAREDEEENDFSCRLILYQSGRPYRELAGNVLTGAGDYIARESLHRHQLKQLRQQLPAGHRQIAAALEQLASALIIEGKFEEAEVPLREALEIRRQTSPDSWETHHAASLLGESLLGQKKSVEAEGNLLAGYEGMNRHKASLPIMRRLQLRHTIECLVSCYEAAGQTSPAATWKGRLRDFDQIQAHPPAPAAP